MKLSEWLKIRFKRQKTITDYWNKISLPSLGELFIEWGREWLGIKRISTKSKAQEYYSKKESSIES